MGFIMLIAMGGIIIGSIIIFIGLYCLKEFFNPYTALTPLLRIFVGLMGILVIFIGAYLIMPCFRFLNHLF